MRLRSVFSLVALITLVCLVGCSENANNLVSVDGPRAVPSALGVCSYEFTFTNKSDKTVDASATLYFQGDDGFSVCQRTVGTRQLKPGASATVARRAPEGGNYKGRVISYPDEPLVYSVTVAYQDKSGEYHSVTSDY